jgi:uncharacterized surface protein with fasciclin (FAS1) repeats
MSKSKWQRLLAAALVAALLVTGFAPAAMAANGQNVPSAVAQQVSGATEVTGTLTGGQFDKIWLGLTPINPGTVTVTAEWDRPNADGSNVGFYVLNENNLTAVLGGNSLIENNVGQGQSQFFLNGPDNAQGASFNATGQAYTVVVFNDSNTDANFTLRVDNATITDDSGEVRVPGEATPEATEEAAADSAEAATPAPVAETAEVTDTAATTTTETVATEAAATPAAAAATPAAAAAVPAGPVRAEVMQGSLPEQFSQHFLGLEPSVRDGEITLVMTYDPQDSTELARRINFWVLDDAGFKRFQAGDSASTVALAAGSKFFLDPDTSNRRSATFNATGFGPYTVIVQNNSRVPATYELTATGGVLLDDSAQTITAQQAGGVTPAATGATTETATAGATTPATTTTTTTTAGSGVVGEPGGSYTVQSGDTLAIIARDIYGDYRLYEQLCAFNSIADCNIIEVGQVINLPTEAEIGAVAAPAAAATTAATPAAAVAAAPATTTTVTTTAAVTGTTAVTGTGAVTSTAPVTTTGATTSTAAVGATGATTRTTTTGAAAAGSDTLLDVLEEAGNYTILLAAIRQAGLESALEGTNQLTVFAPTDDAFNNLFSENNITEARFLQIPELDQLLQLHVIPGRLLEADLANGTQETTLEGSSVTFTVTADGVKINDSFIVSPDVTASNGVVQAIDAVMLPAR